jgi:hypothetical protein
LYKIGDSGFASSVAYSMKCKVTITVFYGWHCWRARQVPLEIPPQKVYISPAGNAWKKKSALQNGSAFSEKIFVGHDRFFR